MEKDYDRYTLVGLSATASLLAFYFIVVSLISSFSFAIDNFVRLWYFMIPLVVGFGVQLGMFFFIKEEMHKKATAQATASTGMSATSMVACCAHHIADIAPFLGITVVGLFLTKYQSTLLLVGILSNILGIAYMASLLETKMPKSKIKAMFYSLLVLSVLAVFASYYFISRSADLAQKQAFLETLTDNQNNVEFKVKPLSASEFEIVMDTHSVNLDFDLEQISTLYDDFGNSYKPIKWEGSLPGGHHRNGILTFSAINKNSKSFKLVITDSAKREFNWRLK